MQIIISKEEHEELLDALNHARSYVTYVSGSQPTLHSEADGDNTLRAIFKAEQIINL